MLNNFVLFSAEYKLAQKLITIGTLHSINIEKNSINQDIYNLATLHGIPLNLITNIDELSAKLTDFYPDTVGISYGHGLIFKSEHIKAFEHGIWNIHTGKLPENRGRHPIAWSFLNNEKKFYISVHSITEEIDMGNLLYESYINREINDNTNDITHKFLIEIQDNLIENAIKNYLTGNIVKLDKGIYNARFDKKFMTIDPSKYDAVTIYNIFKSQQVYGKINVGGSLFSNCNIYHHLIDYPESSTIIQTKRGKIVLE